MRFMEGVEQSVLLRSLCSRAIGALRDRLIEHLKTIYQRPVRSLLSYAKYLPPERHQGLSAAKVARAEQRQAQPAILQACSDVILTGVLMKGGTGCMAAGAGARQVRRFFSTSRLRLVQARHREAGYSSSEGRMFRLPLPLQYPPPTISATVVSDPSDDDGDPARYADASHLAAALGELHSTTCRLHPRTSSARQPQESGARHKTLKGDEKKVMEASAKPQENHLRHEPACCSIVPHPNAFKQLPARALSFSRIFPACISEDQKEVRSMGS